MRRIYSLLLVISVLGMLLTGCNEKPSGTAESTPTPTPSETLIFTPTNEPTETPVQTPTVLPEKKFVFADYVKNKELWDMPYFYEDRFLFEIQGGGDCIVKDGLGDKYTIFSVEGKERWAHAEEWGNFIVNCDGVEWRGGEILETHFGGDEEPKTREEAVQKIFDFLDTYKEISSTGVYYSMNSIYPWQHYAGEAGFHILGGEFAEGYNFQMRLAMTRGAAKQYKTPWYIDFSLWYGGVLDYRDPSPYGKNPDGTSIGGPNNGQSVNCFERSVLMSYMAGSNAVIAEAGGGTCYYKYGNGKTIKIEDKNHPAYGGFFYVVEGEGELTPYGETCKKFYDFTKQYSDVGTAYTPYAVILDYYHGMDGYSSTHGQAFGRFDYEKGDAFTAEIVERIWPTWDKSNHASQRGLVNTKYGEKFDFLMQNADVDLLDTYKALVLTGELNLSDEEVEKYTKYVQNGGCLVVNTAYVNQFKAVELPSKISGGLYQEIEYGNGSFIVFGKGGMFETSINQDGDTIMTLGADYSASGFYGVMELLESRYNFVDVSEDIEYLINIKDDTVYVTLMNNSGVIKYGYEPVVFLDRCAMDVTVKFKENYAIESVKDVYNSTPIEFEDGVVSINMAPGGISVLEFKLK